MLVTHVAFWSNWCHCRFVDSCRCYGDRLASLFTSHLQTLYVARLQMISDESCGDLQHLCWHFGPFHGHRGFVMISWAIFAAVGFGNREPCALARVA